MKKELDLGNEKINKLLLSFSIPCIISMLINSIYNIVDQIFIGKGVGTIGNAATNVIFPIVIICNAVAQLIGNGCAANLSLKLGEGKTKEARKSVGSSITLMIVSSILLALVGEALLTNMVNLFGCTSTVYDSSIIYGRIILIGAPFMIVYTGMASIIRSDGSPRYSMVCLLVGAIINLLLDPLFIFGFNLGVAGGAWATVIGQIVSFVIAVAYIPKIKTVKLEKEDFRINKSILRSISLGLSSFITQMTVFALFLVMNNLMTHYGADSRFGADIPLSVYGVISKLNNLYVSCILGISIGAQPIIGFNFGTGKYDRVKETLKKVIIIGFAIGIIFNIMFQFFPELIVSIFITNADPNYNLFMEFAIDCCRIFLMVCSLNAFEMCSSIIIQSLGNVKKATAVSFTRQIILFIPIALVLCNKIGLYGALYAGPIADVICFIFVIFVFYSEWKRISKFKKGDILKDNIKDVEFINKNDYSNNKIVVTIAREYGSGGRYVGKMLAQNLGVNFYDKSIIEMAAKESGLSLNYIKDTDEKMKSSGYENNNDDRLFIAESKIINNLADKESCVIVGRCADYILKDREDVVKVFIYNSSKGKVDRALKYYGLSKNGALKKINKINKERAKHYKFYTDREWKNFDNYDLCLNSDTLNIEEIVEVIYNFIKKKKS